MAIRYLDADSERNADPSWEFVLRNLHAISAAGSDTVDLVYSEDDLPMMTISGRAGGRFRVLVSTEDGCRALIDPSQPEDEVDVTFPYHTEQTCDQRELVQIDMVLQAAITFYETGTMDVGLHWAPA